MKFDLTESTDGLDKKLAEIVTSHRRRVTILQTIKEITANPDNKVLYFGPTVMDAEIMNFLVRLVGIKSGFIDSGTRSGTRKWLIDQFKNNDLQILCNCEVLTTGFDAPLITHVVVGRPTVSPILFEQMIGRGLRGSKFGGTDECEIVIVQDEFNENPLPVQMGYQQYLEIWNAYGNDIKMDNVLPFERPIPASTERKKLESILLSEIAAAVAEPVSTPTASFSPMAALKNILPDDWYAWSSQPALKDYDRRFCFDMGQRFSHKTPLTERQVNYCLRVVTTLSRGHLIEREQLEVKLGYTIEQVEAYLNLQAKAVSRAS